MVAALALGALVGAGCGSRPPGVHIGAPTTSNASTSSAPPSQTGGGGGTSTSPPPTAGGSGGTATGPPVTPVHWAACTAATGPAGYQCATVTVPLDYADPAKGTIGIAIDRHPATGHKIGSLLVNPGGPGESGVSFLPQMMQELPASVTAAFDVVGFDPRGVGRSDPVVCGTPAQLEQEWTVDPAPPTASGFDALLAADRRFAAGCEAHSGRILPYLSTANAARDMDRIRAALGDPKLTYLGFSYGTFLGATYASLFPTRVRAMVLDGALDPALAPIPLIIEQSASLQSEFNAFLSTCRAGSCGWHPSGNLEADYDTLLARVRAHPVAVPNSGGQEVGAAVLLYGTAAALYSPSNWTFLGQSLEQLQQGNGTGLVELFDLYFGRTSNGAFQNTIEAESAVDCLDSPTPSLKAIQAAVPEVVKVAPTFGLVDLYGEAGCSVWPVPATGKVGPIRAPGSPPIVVVGSTHDPVTPYSWAQSLAHQLQHGVLLTRDGYGHTAYGFSSCIRSAVDTYLITLVPPKAGTTCPSN